MINVYQYENYRKFVIEKLREMPNRGYGQLSKLSRFLGVHTTLISQILKGHKELTSDQAAATADFLGLSDLEAEYFVLLIHLERAGNTASKELYKRQIKRIKAKAQNISERVKSEAKLTEEQRAVFYSDWVYSAVRQAVAIAGISNVPAISEYLDLPKKKVQSVVEFLSHAGLCKLQNGKISVGPASTHLEATSPWIRVHHSNWRQRAMQSMDNEAATDLHYTSPMTLSKKDAEFIREKIIQFIEEINSVVDPSPSEEFYCFDIDWFKGTKQKP